jgi:hypothetical protein
VDGRGQPSYSKLRFVILSGATASRSKAVAKSKDCYPLNSAGISPGILYHFTA